MNSGVEVIEVIDRVVHVRVWCECGFEHETTSKTRGERLRLWHQYLDHDGELYPFMDFANPPPVAVRTADHDWSAYAWVHDRDRSE